MMDLEPKGELPTPRSSFSIFDPKIQLAIYGSSLYRRGALKGGLTWHSRFHTGSSSGLSLEFKTKNGKYLRFFYQLLISSSSKQVKNKKYTRVKFSFLTKGD